NSLKELSLKVNRGAFMTFANKLHYLMLLGGVSQIELANQTKIEKSTLTKILNGATLKPKIDTVFTLAKYFNVDITELLDAMNMNDSNIKFKQDFTLPEVLKNLMESRDISNAHQLGKKAGLPANIIIDILTGRTTNPKIKTLQILANFFSISIPQLCGIDVLPPNYEAAAIATSQISVPKLNLQQIPLWLSGGKLIDNITYLNVNLPPIKEKQYAVAIQDNRYFPDLLVGTTLILGAEVLPRNNDLVVALVDKLISIYEQMDTRDNKVVLREAGSKNEIEVAQSNLKILGTVMQQIINRY